MHAPQALPHTATLVVNAGSRKGRKLFAQAREKLEAAGILLDAAHATSDPARFRVAVREAVRGGAAMVIVGGGDGSLSSAVDEFVGHESVFALLPLGTANSFARSLGVPLDMDGAVDVIAHGCRRRIDLGMIDADYFANSAVMGISPLVGETIPHGVKAVLGRVGYVGWALLCMARFKPFRLTVGEGDKTETLDALEVRIANGGFHGGAELMENAEVDSGDILVQVVVGRQLWTLGWNYVASLLKLPQRHETVREFRGAALRVAADPPQDISIDGEVSARTPFTARVARRAVEVAAPRA